MPQQIDGQRKFRDHAPRRAAPPVPGCRPAAKGVEIQPARRALAADGETRRQGDAEIAGRFERAVGIDSSHDMLAIARTELDRAGLATARVQQGDVYSLNLARDTIDLAVVHQVLHYLDDPARALREAARTLRPGGRMLIVDFAPHGLEFLRDAHAHRRLGFTHQEIARALEGAGLEVMSIRDLPAPASDVSGAGKLTVTLWLARDPRLLVAGGPTTGTLA